MVYDVKPDLTYKSRLVCDGSRVDPRGLSTRSTIVKGVSVHLPEIIVDSHNLEVMTGDIGNDFIQAHTKDKIYIKCGPEFGDSARSIAIIVRALYGLTTSTEIFRTMLADFLRTLEFTPSRFDRDIWMRLRDEQTGYDYIFNHIDDFTVITKNPPVWIGRIASMFFIKEHVPRNYYLGNNYTYHSGQHMWTYGCQIYAKEDVSRVERIYGCLPK